MAITVRLPEQLDQQIAELAKVLHRSKNALLVEAAELLVDRYARRAAVEHVLDTVLDHDRDLLSRLEDA